MPVAPIALDVDEALDVHLDVLAQVALHSTFVLNHLANMVHLFFAQILDLLEGVHVSPLQDAPRARIANTENVRQRDPGLLVAGQIHACNTCHSNSSAASGCVPPAHRRSARVDSENPRGSSQALTPAN